MINRENWILVQKYLDYRERIDQVSRKTIKLERTWLFHLLEWAEENAFEKAHNIRLTFPRYVINARKDGKQKDLSPEYVRKLIGTAKRFFEWLILHQKGFKSEISKVWIETLKPPRLITTPSDHEAVTIEEIREMAIARTISQREERIQAAAVFWFLSGIRIGAFVSLPIKAIDIENLEVKQWPNLGVQTKFKKHQTTYMLNIPDLLKVIKKWDKKVKEVFSPDDLWFAPFSPITCKLDPKNKNLGNYRDDRARKDLREWLNRLGVKYHSPHKFRRGYAIYSIALSKSSKDMKAISQNMMHSSISTTERYIDLPDKDLKEKIVGLAKNAMSGENDVDLIVDQVTNKVVERLLAEIKDIKKE